MVITCVRMKIIHSCFVILLNACLSKVAAVCEALRHRGLLPPRGEAGLGRGGAGGVPMVACDLPLEEILGTSAFPFSQLEEAMGPHVEPAAPPVLEATIP